VESAFHPEGRDNHPTAHPEYRRRRSGPQWEDVEGGDRQIQQYLADLAAYLQARHVEQGWSVKRMRAELRVGRSWLVGEMARLGLRP
jgi:hypothetical protein